MGLKGKNKSGIPRKKLFLTFFSIEILFFVFFFKFLNIICPNQIQESHSFYKKKLH